MALSPDGRRKSEQVAADYDSENDESAHSQFNLNNRSALTDNKSNATNLTGISKGG